MELDYNRLVFPIVILTDVEDNIFILSSGPKNISTETVDSGIFSSCSCADQRQERETTDPSGTPDSVCQEPATTLHQEIPDCAFYRNYSPEHDLIEEYPAPTTKQVPRAYFPEVETPRQVRFLRRMRKFGSDTKARCLKLLSSARKTIRGQLVREHESYSSHCIGTQDLSQGFRQQSQYSFKMF